MLNIRSINKQYPPAISAAFDEIGWNKPVAKYQRYVQEQKAGSKEVLVALMDGVFAGYLVIVWEPEYVLFRSSPIPEIQDLTVLPMFRRKRIGTALMDQAEKLVVAQSNTIGIGVGSVQMRELENHYIKCNVSKYGRKLYH